MTASHDKCVMYASCGLDREDGSRARGIELVGAEVADVMGDDSIECERGPILNLKSLVLSVGTERVLVLVLCW